MASRLKIRVLFLSLKAATLALRACRLAAPFSTKSAVAAPRERASNPRAPDPANRSKTRAFGRSGASRFSRRSRTTSDVGRTRAPGDTRSRPAHLPETILTASPARSRVSVTRSLQPSTFGLRSCLPPPHLHQLRNYRHGDLSGRISPDFQTDWGHNTIERVLRHSSFRERLHDHGLLAFAAEHAHVTGG